MGSPRKLRPDIAFPEAEDEVFFTTATIKADPHAKDLLPMTDGWLDIIDAARLKDRDARKATVEADASRTIANKWLDHFCEKFGDELYLEVDKNRSARRWTQFFSGTANKFIRQAFGKQVNRVRGWLESTDPLLEKHRKELDTWSKAGNDAIAQTNGVAMLRGQARITREQMAEDLTRERDGLHDALSARARTLGLPRDWPDFFFRKESRSGSADDASAPEPPPAPPAT